MPKLIVAVTGAALTLAGATVIPHTPTAPLPVITVYKSPTCGCCAKWVDHVRAAGFPVTVRDQNDLTEINDRLGVPHGLMSCHTAVVDSYVVEGHVPADLVRRLLEERPAVSGLAVPGMPMGSPGMEGGRHDRYDVLTFNREGKTSVYETR